MPKVTVMNNNKFLGNLTLADKLTVLRILLIPVFVAVMFYFDKDRMYLRWLALGVFGLAVLSDFFDGLAARVRREKSDIGMVIDPLADKLLLLTAFIVLYGLRRHLPLNYSMPVWLVLIIVSRDLIILLGIVLLNFMKIEIPIAPSLWGKFTTFFQMAVVLCLLMDGRIFPVLSIAAATLTLISGFGYFARGVKAINAGSIHTRD